MFVKTHRWTSMVIALAMGLSLALLTGLAASFTGAAGPHCTVGAAGNYSSIQAALDDASCDTIAVDAGVYNENVFVIRDVTISGAGPGSTIADSSGSGDVLRVSANGVVTISNMTFQNGERGVNINSSRSAVTLKNIEVINNVLLSGDGAGIINNTGELMLVDSLVAYNVVSNTSGGNDAGGIYNISGETTIENSTILSNTTMGGNGGGIYNVFGALALTLSHVGGNISGQNGGGIYNNMGQLTVIDSTIADNRTDVHGGGIFNTESGELRLARSTISGNRAGPDGSGSGIGGGIYNFISSADLLNVTISGNSAGLRAGGIYNVGSGLITATMALTNTTIASNTENFIAASLAGGIETGLTATMSLKHVILAYNSDLNCSDSLSTIANTLSNNHNLSSDSSCDGILTEMKDQKSSDPLLAVLGDYGGETETHALGVGSPAIDAGLNADCPSRDQRKINRPFDGDNIPGPKCDIGAYEVAPPRYSALDTATSEGDSGLTSAEFEVSLFGIPTQTLTVDYATVDGSALASSDYIAASGTVTFSVGGPNRQSILVDIIGETLFENDETLAVILSNPSSGLILDATGTGSILNDDPLPGISIADTDVTEGDTGTTAAVFTVTLSNASAFTITVDYETGDGTAVAPSDYLTATGTITFTPGQGQETIVVDVVGDSEPEPDDTFFVNLNSSNGGLIVTGQGVGTINNDDAIEIYLPIVLKEP